MSGTEPLRPRSRTRNDARGSIRNALSGNSKPVDTVLGPNVLRLLDSINTNAQSRLTAIWSHACVLVTDCYMEQLLFTPARSRNPDGSHWDLNPFSTHVAQLTPEGVGRLLRIVVAYRLAVFLANPDHCACLKTHGLSVGSFVQDVSQVFGFDHIDRTFASSIGRPLLRTGAAEASVKLYRLMWSRAGFRTPVPEDPAVCAHWAALLAHTTDAFMRLLRRNLDNL